MIIVLSHRRAVCSEASGAGRLTYPL